MWPPRLRGAGDVWVTRPALTAIVALPLHLGNTGRRPAPSYPQGVPGLVQVKMNQTLWEMLPGHCLKH